MSIVLSKDGTAIAYDKVGHGPAIILINGALGYRNLNGEKELVSLLSQHFSVISYDRRGRGGSKEIKPYLVESEIEDIEALIDQAGGSAFLQGTSSGAALALLAAAKLGPDKVKKMSLYEPPYNAYMKDGRNEFSEVKKKITDLIHKGRASDAMIYFFESIGTPPEGLEAMKNAPDWGKMHDVAHTLVYDFEILGNGTIPLDVIRSIAIPTQILYGEKSFDFMQQTARTLAENNPNVTSKGLKGQTHQVSDDILFSELSDFFTENQTINSKVIHASPQTVFKAFTDPRALEIWFAPEGMNAKVDAFDFRVGGSYTMSLFYPESDTESTGKTSDKEDRYTAEFIEIIENEKIVQEITFDSSDPAFAGKMIMEVIFEPGSIGTKVTFIFKNIPKGIKQEDNEQGTISTLEQLAKFMEQIVTTHE